MARLQKYLRDKFGTERIVLGPKPARDGSVEVHLGGEFIGIIYRDEEDGEVSYAFHMAIMEMDLPAVAGVCAGFRRGPRAPDQPPPGAPHRRRCSPPLSPPA